MVNTATISRGSNIGEPTHAASRLYPESFATTVRTKTPGQKTSIIPISMSPSRRMLGCFVVPFPEAREELAGPSSSISDGSDWGCRGGMKVGETPRAIQAHSTLIRKDSLNPRSTHVRLEGKGTKLRIHRMWRRGRQPSTPELKSVQVTQPTRKPHAQRTRTACQPPPFPPESGLGEGDQFVIENANGFSRK